MEEPQLTKKEKRELAKEEKRKTKQSDVWSSRIKNIFIILAVVLGAWYLFKYLGTTTTPGGLQTKFEEYASEIGLDVNKFKEDIKKDEFSDRIQGSITNANQLGVNSTPTFYLNGSLIENPRGVDAFSTLIDEGKETDYSYQQEESDRVWGSETAKVTLIEYADFQCPACATYYPIVKELKEKYPEDLRVVFRHFPLITIHKNAFPSAIAAEAAQEQGKFWEMHDILFEKQGEWSDLR